MDVIFYKWNGQRIVTTFKQEKETAASKPNHSFADPVTYAWMWKGRSKRSRQVLVLPPGNTGAAPSLLPVVLRLPGQWVVRKPPLVPDAVPAKPRRAPPTWSLAWVGTDPLRCCLNGWADPAPNKSADARRIDPSRYYTTCNARAPTWQQATCQLPARRTECLRVFACHTVPRRRRAGGGNIE